MAKNEKGRFGRWSSFFSQICLHLNFLLAVLRLLIVIGLGSLEFLISLLFQSKPKCLKGQLILVTGGGNGIGREICVQLAKREPTITLISWDVNEAANDQLIKELRSMGVQNAYRFRVDVSSREEVKAAAKLVRKQIGEVTMLFNNAGIACSYQKAWQMDAKEVSKVFEVNVLSHAWTLEAFLPPMIERGCGHVVEVCSIMGFYSTKNSSTYVATKHALKGYIETVKEDLRSLAGRPKIHFTIVYPHNTMTTMTAKLNFCAGKFPFLMPKLTPELVASKMVEGVLRDEENIYIPGHLRAASMILPLLPPKAVRMAADIFDVRTDLDDNKIL